MSPLKVILVFLVLWVLMRAVQTGCAAGTLRVQEPVVSAVRSAVAGTPLGRALGAVLGGSSILVEEPASALKEGFKLYGAAWCTFTQKQWRALTGSEWSEGEAAYAADPQVVQCDKAAGEGGPAEGSVDRAVCEQTGYPTVLDTTKGGFPKGPEAVGAYLREGSEATGVYLGFDEGSTAAFKR